MDLPEQPEVKGDAGKVLRWVNTILITLGGVMAGSMWADQKSTNAETKASLERWQEKSRSSMDSLKDSLHEMKTEAAVFSASRFSSSDWVKAKENMDAKFNDQDRRLGKVEDGLISIKDSLITIKGGLGLLNGGKE